MYSRTIKYHRQIPSNLFVPVSTDNFLTALEALDVKSLESIGRFVAQLTYFYFKPFENVQCLTKILKPNATELLRNTGISASQITRLKDLIDDTNIRLVAKTRGIDFSNQVTRMNFISLLDSVYPQIQSTVSVAKL